jgi:hypothetical protein
VILYPTPIEWQLTFLLSARRTASKRERPTQGRGNGKTATGESLLAMVRVSKLLMHWWLQQEDAKRIQQEVCAVYPTFLLALVLTHERRRPCRHRGMP